MGKWEITVTNLVKSLLEGAVNAGIFFLKDPAGNPTKETVSIKLGDRRSWQHLLHSLTKSVNI